MAATPEPRTFETGPGARTAKGFTLALLAVSVVVFAYVSVHRQLRDGNDFPIYWQAARDLIANRSPYDVGSGLHGYVYLPWVALLLGPLAVLPLPLVFLAGRQEVRFQRIQLVAARFRPFARAGFEEIMAFRPRRASPVIDAGMNLSAGSAPQPVIEDIASRKLPNTGPWPIGALTR